MKDIIAARLIVWFTLNPEIEMTAKELALKFEKPDNTIRACVTLLSKRGFLITRIDSGKLHVSIGPELQKEIDR